MWSCSQASDADAYNQHWRIARGIGAADGHYMIASRQIGRLVDGTTGAEGVDVQQWPYGGNIDQQYWRFEPLTGPEPTPSSGGNMQDGDAGLGGEPSTGGVAGGSEVGAGDEPSDSSGGVAPIVPTGGMDLAPTTGGALVSTGGETTDSGAGGDSGCGCAVPRKAPASTTKTPAIMFVAVALTVRLARRRAAARAPTRR